MAELWAAHGNLEVVRILLKQSDPLAACTLVEAISSLLNRSWSVQVKHIPQERSLVADRADAICRGGPIGMLKLMIDPVDLVVLVNKEANDDW
ncbi:hypothetical protein V6N13_091305 [Hibiscus sabdariffa]|uniref:Uncharacterized protein n=1 Tax=Hibiscus sabdariffa TaxID=183260 RepID=A0ABR2BUQ8_9ROSI